MNRKVYTSIVVAVVCLAFGLLTGCSSSSAPVIAISATAGSGQSQTVGEAFTTALEVTVTSNGNPASGVTVTFSAPSSGASCTPATASGTTGSDGTLSTTCTANSTAGGYSVTATATGATSTASFTETNVAPSVFVFYVSGQEAAGDYYAIAGGLAFDLSGNILGGEEDYNDGIGGVASSGEPTTADTIAPTSATTPSSLTVDQTTGTGTLVLVDTTTTTVGVAGTETFTVQFINSNHALITQFDGSATSSGSFDLQSATSLSGNFAFTVSGTDEFGGAVGYGGVFSDAGSAGAGAISGTVDENDEGTLSTGNTLTATDNGVPSTDAYGRGTITGFGDIVNDEAVSLAYYVVGPEVARIIDVDIVSGSADTAVGSAYGQGTVTAFDGTYLGTADVFGVENSDFSGEVYAGAGNLVPSGAVAGTAGASFTGEGDDDEEGSVVSDSATAGTYTIATNGYGSVTFTTALQDIASFGLYATDPTLNLLDPNNTSNGGGNALVLDLDSFLAGGTGIVIPQGATTSSDFNGLSYGFGAQAPSDAGEFDYVGQGSFDTTQDLTATANINDPFNFFENTAGGQYSAVVIVGTASGPDSAGRYTYPVNPFAVGPVGATAAVDFTEVMYEAGPAYSFSLDTDTFNIWLGTFQEQSTSSKAAFRGKKAATTAPTSKTNKK